LNEVADYAELSLLGGRSTSTFDNLESCGSEFWSRDQALELSRVFSRNLIFWLSAMQ